MERRLDFFEHLEELRRRVILIIFAVALLSVLAYPLTDDMILEIKENVLGEYKSSVIVKTPMEAVMVRIKLSLLLGTVFSLPLMLYELFKFLEPALYIKERKIFLFGVSSLFALFLVGTVFSYLVFIPQAMQFLLGFATPVAQPLLGLDDLISSTVFLIVTVGLVFEWPLLVAVLSSIGMVSAKTLSRYRKHAVVLCFLIGAIITPDPTVVMQTIVSIPMVLLYEVGIMVAKIIEKNKKN